MSTKHFKSNTHYSQSSLNVDNQNGVIKNVVIVQQGENKNGTYFNQSFLNDLVNKGNAQKQGIKSRFGHPNMCATTLGAYLGRFKNFSQKRNKVFADLYLDDISKQTQVPGRGISMYDYVIQMADQNPDMFGNSIVIASNTFSETIEEQIHESHKLHSFIASDLVDDPAATDSLFNNSKDLGIIVTQFLDENPLVFESVIKDPSIIEDFFERYFKYSNNKSNYNAPMSLLKNLQKKFSKTEQFDIELTLADGNIVKVITEAQEPMEGDRVVDNEGNPVPDGEHLLPDGGKIITAGGTITQIQKPEEETEESQKDPAPTLQQVMNSVDSLTQSFNSFRKSVQKSTKDSEQAIEFLGDQLSEYDSKFKTLAKSVRSKFDTPPAEETELKPMGELSLYDKVQAKLKEKQESKNEN